MKNAIAYSVPIFFILIGIELLYGLITHKKLYRLNDSISNLSCGIGQQVLGAWFKILTVLMYAGIYNHLRLFTIPDNWYTVVLLFLGVDFFYYWFHRLSHEINAIWATHIVHHQSEEYNLSVALRQSWFQTLFSSLFYIPLSFLGFSVETMLIVMSFNTLYQFWIHTKAINRLPAPLEYIFNTPSHHRVHHGSNPKYIDKNHAGTLIIWDRMFGTFQQEEEEVIYGITTPLRSWNPVWANFHYWKDLFTLSARSHSFKDKINAFIQPPGWQPRELGGFQHPKEIDVAHYHKFDTKVASWINLYAFVQFVFVLGLTSYFMFFSGNMFDEGQEFNLLKFSLIAIYILLAIYNMGALFENRTRAFWLEIVRNLLNIGLIGLFIRESYFMPLAISVSLFTIASVVFLIIKAVSKPQLLKHAQFEA